MTGNHVRRWSLFLLPVLAACGLTDLVEPDVPVEPEVLEFEDDVTSADPTGMSFTLRDGSIVRVVADTESKADERGRIHDLGAVHAALEADLPVRAWGKGEVAQDDPLILDAMTAGFVIERPVREFEGSVASVQLEGRRLVFEDGTAVWLAEHTEMKADENGDRHELVAVHEALEAGRRVVAWGAGEVESEEPLVLEALQVGFQIEEVRVRGFEGVVAAVHLTHDKLELENGTFVRVTDRTELPVVDGVVITPALIHLALEAGIEVAAWGSGEVEKEEPLVLEALELSVEFGPDPGEDPNLQEFSGRVDFIDAGSIFLLDGTELIVLDETEVVAANELSPGSMDALVATLEAGRRVHAHGVGRVDPDAALRITADRLVLEVEVSDFEQDVSSVDWMSGALVLEDGTLVFLTDDTTLTAADAVSPSDLSGVFASLMAGYRVRAWGSGYVIGGTEAPGDVLSLEGVSVTLQQLPAS